MLKNQLMESVKGTVNITAEKGVVGAMIMDSEVVDEISRILVPSDFCKPEHSVLFEAIVGLVTDGKLVDQITVFNRAISLNESFNTSGFTECIASITQHCPYSERAMEYAVIVKDSSRKREYLALLETAYSEVADSDDLDSVSSGIVNKLELVKETSGTENSMFQFKEMFIERTELIDKKQKGEVSERFIRTGLNDLDKLLNGGLRHKHFDILAARPAMGKTSLACQFILHAALDCGIPSLIFSIEMAKDDITDKMISITSGVPYRKILNADISEGEWDRFTKAAMKVNSANASELIIDDTTRDLNKIVSTVRLAKRKYGIQFVVIDYLQLVTIPGKYNTRDEQLGYAVNTLAYIAKMLDINILALSQINRGVEARIEKRPMLSDLRESGNIEQAAWRVLSIYRDEYYNPEGDSVGLAEIAVLKGKVSNTGKILVGFDKECTKFNNLDWKESR